VHGWPGSVVEFLDVIGPLTDPRAYGDDPADAFHVVVPSLPGHGFSGPVTEAGWTDGRVAAAFTELMARLGYDRYGVQGGDVGAFIAPQVGRLAPEHVIGVHVNAFVTFPSGDPADVAALTEAEQHRLALHENFQDDQMGYMQIQGTRPQTIAYGLTDSPVGQLAWVVEKFQAWSNPAAEVPEDAVDRGRLLTNVMLYWLTGTARSSANSYYERFHDASMWAPKERSTVPTGVAVFPTDVAIRRFGERTDTIVHWSEYDRGGHFAALEAPDLLVGDVRAFYRGLRLGRSAWPASVPVPVLTTRALNRATLDRRLLLHPLDPPRQRVRAGGLEDHEDEAGGESGGRAVPPAVRTGPGGRRGRRRAAPRVRCRRRRHAPRPGVRARLVGRHGACRMSRARRLFRPTHERRPPGRSTPWERRREVPADDLHEPGALRDPVRGGA
jgi:pimeloyl-ACP methyl ester carboxylesterase